MTCEGCEARRAAHRDDMAYVKGWAEGYFGKTYKDNDLWQRAVASLKNLGGKA